MRTQTQARRADEDHSIRAPLTKLPPQPGRRLVRLRGGLRWVVGVYLLLIAGILAYNARVTDHQRSSALVVNIAGRQHAFAERYVKDVLLKAAGFQAAPEEDAAILQGTAAALLQGGKVLAVQGADATIEIQPASGDWRVIAKLRQEQALIRELVGRGEDVLASDPASASFSQQVLRLRITGAQMSAISNDAVGQMTVDLDNSLRRLRLVGLALGLIGTLAAIARTSSRCRTPTRAWRPSRSPTLRT